MFTPINPRRSPRLPTVEAPEGGPDVSGPAPEDPAAASAAVDVATALPEAPSAGPASRAGSPDVIVPELSSHACLRCVRMCGSVEGVVCDRPSAGQICSRCREKHQTCLDVCYPALNKNNLGRINVMKIPERLLPQWEEVRALARFADPMVGVALTGFIRALRKPRGRRADSPVGESGAVVAASAAGETTPQPEVALLEVTPRRSLRRPRSASQVEAGSLEEPSARRVRVAATGSPVVGGAPAPTPRRSRPRVVRRLPARVEVPAVTPAAPGVAPTPSPPAVPAASAAPDPRPVVPTRPGQELNLLDPLLGALFERAPGEEEELLLAFGRVAAYWLVRHHRGAQ
jgi:hypothetical protein